MRAASATAALLAVALALPAGAGAAAQTVTVTSLTDSGLGGCTPDECTLREAVYLLDDGDTDADRIEIPLSGPAIPLIAPLPPIDEPLTIAGTGSAPPVISGQNATRVMTITAPTSGTAVTLSGLTVTDGNFGNTGGAIMNFASTLTLDHVTVADSHTTTANDEGGGIYSSGPLTLQSSTITGNFTNGAASHGGGLSATAGLTVRDSLIAGNRTNGSFAAGAGIMRSGAGATVIENSTITDNHTSPNATGGGAYLSVLPATIRNSTVFANSAGGEGGGLYGSGGIEVTNSIVSNNTAGTVGPDISSPFGATVLAFDIVGTVSGVASLTEPVPGSNRFGVDPQLGPLADNGGPTQTLLPSAASPALDQGSSDLATDQRGLGREVDLPDAVNSAAAGADASDIGAVERQPPEPPATGGAEFTLGKLTRDKRKGTAQLEIAVTAAGSLELTGPGLKPNSAELPGAGSTTLRVKATGKKKRKLRKRGSVKVDLSVQFTPATGAASSKTASVKLKRRHRR